MVVVVRNGGIIQYLSYFGFSGFSPTPTPNKCLCHQSRLCWGYKGPRVPSRTLLDCGNPYQMNNIKGCLPQLLPCQIGKGKNVSLKGYIHIFLKERCIWHSIEG